MPMLSEVIVIHGALLVATHVHPLPGGTVTSKLPVPPLDEKDCVEALRVAGNSKYTVAVLLVFIKTVHSFPLMLSQPVHLETTEQ